jgi:hypothetical protein
MRRNQAPEKRGREAMPWATPTVKGLKTDAAKPKARARRLMPRPVMLSQPRARARGTMKTTVGTSSS